MQTLQYHGLLNTQDDQSLLLAQAMACIILAPPPPQVNMTPVLDHS